ncbi:MAG: hypothetical protein U5N85_07895 [Arcicella sp.]|nr:hypothetical protein [Arcicella sp.]
MLNFSKWLQNTSTSQNNTGVALLSGAYLNAGDGGGGGNSNSGDKPNVASGSL